MKIGYLTKQSPFDKKAYSGTHYYMMRALQESFEEVSVLGPVDTGYKWLPKIKGRILRTLSGTIYKYQYNIGLAKKMAAIIDRKIAREKPDVLLASLMNPEVAFLKSDIPLFLTSDATFPLLHDLYDSHSNLHKKSIEEALYLERKAFERARKLIPPTQWMANSAMNDYGISAGKIEVIPYGANLDEECPEEEIEALISARSRAEVLRLLFVGVRWEEKGGPFTMKVLQELQQRGVKAELCIVGCNPKIEDKPEGARVLGFLDKGNPKDAQKLTQLYRETSFFMLPTQAECYGIVYIEAASFALPAIGSDTGGVPEIIVDGETGFVRDENQSVGELADWIEHSWIEKKEYRRFSLNSRRRYTSVLNWKRWGEQVRELILSELS
ncbi:MAG: glycosyltransferase family 4 protein [Balneolaceae bacterium]|nr:glycosyltransferase family 4 protein [Balneolaceae bacterium]